MTTQVEWGVRYLDGKIMRAYDRETAHRRAAEVTGRMVMSRDGDGPWRSVALP